MPRIIRDYRRRAKPPNGLIKEFDPMTDIGQNLCPTQQKFI